MKSEGLLVNKKHRLPAFSLQEMMVVLCITVIVVALAFSVLQLVQRQMHGINAGLDSSTKINLMEQGIWNDLYQASETHYDSKRSTLLFSNEIKKVSYSFGEAAIIRNSDTLYRGAYELRLFWNGEEIQAGRLDAIGLVIEPTKRGSKIFAFKRHTATDEISSVWDLK